MTDESLEKWCRERIVELEAENRDLRRAASKFGELAERLNTQLREERRSGRERRHAPREFDDRRSTHRGHGDDGHTG